MHRSHAKTHTHKQNATSDYRFSAKIVKQKYLPIS